MTPWKLLALPPLPLEAIRSMLGELPVSVLAPARRDQEAVREAIAEVDLVLGDWSAQLELGEEEAAAARRLAFVQQPAAGVERIDVAAFTRRGIPVANVSGANAVGVAEWCLAATFALLRSITWADREMQEGRWPGLAVAARPSRNLAGRRVGVVGFGPIGLACAQRFAALGAQVCYWSRRRRPAPESAGASYLELDELCAHSDVLVVVIALAESTRGLLDARRIAALPPEAILVNAARGGIVDEQAVAAAVRAGALTGAAFDVFATEPLPQTSPLRGCDRILLSPHAAGASRESLEGIRRELLANLQRALDGRPVLHLVDDVNPIITRRS
ncbi:MAG: NAD(P)-dependent oxidoreductase [Mycobacteriales bacterium]